MILSNKGQRHTIYNRRLVAISIKGNDRFVASIQFAIHPPRCIAPSRKLTLGNLSEWSYLPWEESNIEISPSMI